ncbi:MAG: hypothetical protein HC825_07850, partial [Oscillatoriales cyanobacterium RM1_1_9]|nr:hypothetical protein [Oscillatoriales cyanobacterium RM1_1_9]
MGAILSLLMGGIAIALAFKFRPQVPLSSGSPAEFPTSLQTQARVLIKI